MSPRNKRIRRVGSPPVLKGFNPIGLPHNEVNVVSILYEEYEALRLVDYSGFITVFHHHDEENQECTSCESENIEDINKSLRDWKEKPANDKNKSAPKEYCICTNCNYGELHKRGVPCFSLACPDCNIPLIRKGT